MRILSKASDIVLDGTGTLESNVIFTFTRESASLDMSSHTTLKNVFGVVNDLGNEAVSSADLLLSSRDLVIGPVKRARLEGTYEAFDWYAGLAYEHVFDGKAEGELQFGGATAALDAPSLKGDSAIVDLGSTMKPEASGPWTIGVGLKGYAGDRRGGTGSVNVLYTF